jgi:hypothetical protein
MRGDSGSLYRMAEESAFVNSVYYIMTYGFNLDDFLSTALSTPFRYQAISFEGRYRADLGLYLIASNQYHSPYLVTLGIRVLSGRLHDLIFPLFCLNSLVPIFITLHLSSCLISCSFYHYLTETT